MVYGYWIIRCLAIFSFYCNYVAHAAILKDALSFFAIGDWGGIPIWPYQSPVQLAVSRRMAAIANNQKMAFVLSLGDHFYLNGVRNVFDERFQETYENAFNDSSLHIPWFLVAGNHDYYGNVSAQVAYSKLSKRWKFPDYYYKLSFVIPVSKMVIDIIMIDTVILCGNSDFNYSFDQPQLLEEDRYASERHWLWLAKTLKKSKAHYLLVAGHYPVYSIGFHGNTDCLVQRLVPLLERHKVNAYFSGHDHSLQHIRPEGHGWEVEYFVSGSTSFIDDTVRHIDHIPPNSLKFHWGNLFSFGAMCYVEASSTKITVVFMESSGETLYTYSFPPRFKFKNSFVCEHT